MVLSKTIVEISHSERLFCAAADGMIAELRQVMEVPDLADADVEQEFAALRSELGGHFPEFCKLFAALLTRHLGREHLPPVLAALRSEPAQRYLQVASEIEAGLEQLVVRLGGQMQALLDESTGQG